MTSIIANLFTWPFAVGILIGLCLDTAKVYVRACWLDHHRPRPDGKRRPRFVGIDMRWVAGAVAIGVVGWSIFRIQAYADEAEQITADARDFASQVQECQAQLIGAILGSRAVTADNDRLSKQERSLLADGQRLTSQWIGSLINPPPDIEDLPEGDPVRERYVIERTRSYSDGVADINRRIEAVHAEQTRNETERPPLPDPDCGK